jgi:hypothetical protein
MTKYAPAIRALLACIGLSLIVLFGATIIASGVVLLLSGKGTIGIIGGILSIVFGCAVMSIFGTGVVFNYCKYIRLYQEISDPISNSSGTYNMHFLESLPTDNELAGMIARYYMTTGKRIYISYRGVAIWGEGSNAEKHFELEPKTNTAVKKIVKTIVNGDAVKVSE